VAENDADAFAAAVAIVLAHEGGFQIAHDDPGNWTGGRVGAGDLKGTKYGISAAQYPALDIAGLSEADAAAIYRRDWWDRYDLGTLPPQVAAKLFDAGVNIGMIEAATGLQRALRACGHPLAEDGVLGAATRAAAMAVPTDILLPALREALAGHYRLVAARDPAMERFLTGWLARAYS
jgi:lysozyme family protein